MYEGLLSPALSGRAELCGRGVVGQAAPSGRADACRRSVRGRRAPRRHPYDRDRRSRPRHRRSHAAPSRPRLPPGPRAAPPPRRSGSAPRRLTADPAHERRGPAVPLLGFPTDNRPRHESVRLQLRSTPPGWRQGLAGRAQVKAEPCGSPSGRAWTWALVPASSPRPPGGRRSSGKDLGWTAPATRANAPRSSP